METASANENRLRRPVAALLLSFLAPGIGHIYCGQLGKGIFLLTLNMFLGLLGFFGLLTAAFWLQTLALIAVGLGLVVWIWACKDAWRLAKRLNSVYTLRDYNRWYVYAILILTPITVSHNLAFYVRDNVMMAFRMSGRGMEPTIHINERVMASKLAYRDGPVSRGDIVVFINPNKRNEKNIKRVIALPADKVAIRAGTVYVNGQPVPGTRPDTQPSAPGHELPEQTILNGHCFVLCDDRSAFYDSRSYGQIPLADIVGRLDYIYYPRWVNLTANNTLAPNP